jgi:CRP-like cAMP-binding protein
MNIDEEQFELLINKIDVLTSIVALTSSLPEDFKNMTKTDKIKTIYKYNSNIDRNLIALIVGTSPETVSVRLSEMRNNNEIK